MVTNEEAYNQGREFGIVIGKRLAYNEFLDELKWYQALAYLGAIDVDRTLDALTVIVRRLHAATDERAFAEPVYPFRDGVFGTGKPCTCGSFGGIHHNKCDKVDSSDTVEETTSTEER